MKYYIDDKLVRTSDRTYTHAVMCGDEVYSCCGSFLLANKELSRRLAYHEQNIQDSRLAIKALDEGKRFYMTTVCRKPYKVKIERSREEYLERIADNEARATRWHIRELEAR